MSSEPSNLAKGDERVDTSQPSIQYISICLECVAEGFPQTVNIGVPQIPHHRNFIDESLGIQLPVSSLEKVVKAQCEAFAVQKLSALLRVSDAAFGDCDVFTHLVKWKHSTFLC